ncbi:hypothetical protein ACOMHN_027926 [Nucella lapillus]
MALNMAGSDRSMMLFALCASFGAFSFGYTIGLSAPAIPSMVSEGMLTEGDVGWFGGLIPVGALIGGPLSGWCIDRFGRKRTVFFSSLPFLLSHASMIITKTTLFVFVGRFLSGLASGMVMVSASMYIAEIATKSRRGVLGSSIESFIVIGVFVAFVVGLGKDWKRLAFVGLFPAALASIAACLLPESPRWLLTQNRKREALQALTAVREPRVDVEEELRDMEEGIRTLPVISWSELYSKEELRRPLLLTLIIYSFQQMTGISAVTFYTVTIFNTLIPDRTYIATVIVGFVKMVVTIASCMQVDQVGRKTLVTLGGSIMALCLFLFGMCYRLTLNLSPDSALSTWLPVVCLTGANMGFAVGWGLVPVLYMSEVFPAQCRGKAGAVATFVHWMVAFFVAKEFSTLQLMLGNGGVFYFFSFFCVLGVGFVWRYLPETKGKSLEEIQQYFLTYSRGRV